MTVSVLVIAYLLQVVGLSGFQALDVWSYHLRKYEYARKSQDEDVMEATVLGQEHLDKVNASAYEWLAVNCPGHAWITKYRQL